MSDATKELTLSVPDAGRRLGLGRDASYEAARRGGIPTLRFGRFQRVPVVALNRMLEDVGRDPAPDRAAERARKTEPA